MSGSQKIGPLGAENPNLLGKTACDVVANIMCSTSNIDSLSLVNYVEGPNWRDLNERSEKTDASLLRGIEQDRGERIITRLSREEVSAEKLRAFAHSLPPNRLLAAISRVSLAIGGTAHIPMMDFMCPPSDKNLELLVGLLRNLRQGRGCLLKSGRSYHYYGFELLSEEQWRIFLGKCLLMFGYSDDRYIGHQLVDGHCVLRLSSGALKTTIPTVVAEF